jgi:predicted unusual protein kinase regulating ubiquinone biosynthesis (AarF/ABC1/UbiB family)
LKSKSLGEKILRVLAQAWGAQFFEMRMFHADPHPGNICFDVDGANGKGKGAVGLLDWGQVKFVSNKLAVDFSHMIEAINSGDQNAICQGLQRLGATRVCYIVHCSRHTVAVKRRDFRK